jgi:hypothetical protein
MCWLRFTFIHLGPLRVVVTNLEFNLEYKGLMSVDTLNSYAY